MPGPFCFAWAGGVIQEQIVLTTTGTTHGARFERVAIVGDTTGLHAQLTNLASSDGLTADAFYQLTGPGITDPTYFIFDDSILRGLPNSINISQAASATQSSATFQATTSVPVGTVVGQLTQGVATILFDGGDLPAGTYGIFGNGIGETDVPIGTTTGTTYIKGGGVMTVGSCFVDYDGSGSGSLYTYAATPHTTNAHDQFGNPTTVTNYTVAAQGVRASTTGQFSFQITGFPTGDPASITNVPTDALAGLTAGLVYNIAGNGIPVGTTFIAPSGGSTIDMDLDATASELAAILTITGPRAPNAPFDPAVHNRFDEEILSVDISQEEGGFATLTVDIKNPNIGLLALGRNLWCWLSWDTAWTPAGGSAPDLEPLFNGRLVGVPKLQAGEVVQLQFLARPDDLNAQKLALADSMAVLPYYDPIWFSTNVSPDTVLETYSALWHIDRRSLSVTASDILEGEDGIIDIGEDWSLYDHFSLSYGQPPLVATTVTGTVTWQQQAEGTLDVTQRILNAFYAAGSVYKYSFAKTVHGLGGGGMIQVLAGSGLKDDWPKPGTNIGGGWSLSNLKDQSGVELCYIVDATSPQGGWIKQTYYNVIYEGMSPPAASTSTSNVDVFLHPFGTFSAAFPLNVYKIRMNLEYKANRKRTETVTAVVMAGVQQELSDSAENDREAIALTSEYVGQAVDLDGTVPIGNVAYRSYFQTARGTQSFEYLLLAARAKMRARARSVDITFAVAWPNALGITLRHSVQLTDRRLPGGVAVGKVKSYKLSCANGVMLGEFTIGASIGTGDSTAPQAGAPSYAEAGYCDDYQTVTGAQIPLAASDGDFAYQTLDDFIVVDDGLDLTSLTADTAVNECVVINGMFRQMDLLRPYQRSAYPQNGNPIKQNISTQVTLDLKPLQGSEFHTGFFPAVTPLTLPKTIDLSAPAPGT
jgi:hypothetical protein